MHLLHRESYSTAKCSSFIVCVQCEISVLELWIMQEEESLLTFPCQFPIKIMGVQSPTFETSIVMVARKHIPNLGEGSVKSRTSKTGKYLSVTITFQADSREQLDNLYRELSARDDVKMVL